MTSSTETLKEPLQVGQEVIVIHYDGVVSFIGDTHFAPGKWVGVTLHQPLGKNDGSVQGVRYFTCEQLHGIFLREENVKPNPARQDEEDDVIESLMKFRDVKLRNRTSMLSATNSSSMLRPDDTHQDLEECCTSLNLRRYAVTAGARSKNLDIDISSIPVYEKSEQDRSDLRKLIKELSQSRLNVYFNEILEDEDKQLQLIEHIGEKDFEEGQPAFVEGDEAKYLYIVRSGKFTANYRATKRLQGSQKVDRSSITTAPASPASTPGVEMWTSMSSGGDTVLLPGDSFGEEALLYLNPRTFSVVATEKSKAWVLDRITYREMVLKRNQEQFKNNIKFLKNVDIFSSLDDEKLAVLAECLEEEEFEPNEAIIEQGDRDSHLYILLEGEAVACVDGDQGEVTVNHYKKGGYFGEIALLQEVRRQASIYAVTHATCLYIDRETFVRLLGPLRDLLEGNLTKYEKYLDAVQKPELRCCYHIGVEMLMESTAVKDAKTGHHASFEKDLALDAAAQGETSMTTTQPATSTQMLTLRSASAAQSAEEKTQVESKPSPTESQPQLAAPEEEEEPEPTDLREKVQHDFKKPALVGPSQDFCIEGAEFQMFGGMRPGETFTCDKVVEVRTKITPKTNELEDIYSWADPGTALKGATAISVLCQKGQKSENDPTPNQDNYFVLFKDDVQIYGVIDGHGPFGHLVSFRVVQTLPFYLCKSSHYRKDWKEAIAEAFREAECELLKFAELHNVNVEASGAAGTVCVKQGLQIHVGHIGDAGALIGHYSRHDSKVICGTKDHKPELPAERARLEAAGSDVREYAPGTYRIYMKGTDFPGLTMSRSFGDIACNGVSQEPDYTMYEMKPDEEVYGVFASDGIWEFMDYEKVVELTSKKLRLKGPAETGRFATEASRKRWKHACGDYCDDITAIVVQWNAKVVDKENMVLTVQRHA